LSDVFQEVEESLLEDKTRKLWKRWRWVVYVLVAAIVLGTLVHGLWRQQTEAARVARMEAFEAAQADYAQGRFQEAADALTPLAQGKTEIAPLAAHMLARVRLEGFGDAAAAVQALQLAVDGRDPVLSRQALLKIGYLRAGELSFAELEALMAPLAGEDDAFGALAMELIASKALETGDFARARSDFGLLRIAPNAPAGVQQRADNALAAMSTLPVDAQAPAPVQEPAPTPAPAPEGNP
jgi:hypothetical protein